MSQAIVAHYRAKEGAAYLGIAQSTFWRWVKEGRIAKGTRLSARCTVWSKQALEEFLKKQVGASAEGAE